MSYATSKLATEFRLDNNAVKAALATAGVKPLQEMKIGRNIWQLWGDDARAALVEHRKAKATAGKAKPAASAPDFMQTLDSYFLSLELKLSLALETQTIKLKELQSSIERLVSTGKPVPSLSHGFLNGSWPLLPAGVADAAAQAIDD